MTSEGPTERTMPHDGLKHWVPIRRSLGCCSTGCGHSEQHIAAVDPQVITSCLPPKRRVLENAGVGFFNAYEVCSDSEDSDESDCSSVCTSATGGATSPNAAAKKNAGRSRKKKVDVKQKMDASKIRELLRLEKTLYETLNLADGASPDEIKKAYRTKVLTTHPDKIKGHGKFSTEEMEACRVRFHKVQEAYEVLSDIEVKRQYDSGLPFEVSVPGLASIQRNFYGIIGPLFKKWARFSSVQPVPEFGDADSDVKQVKTFYQFWYEFESTRDYSQHDEHDLKDASYKEERMYMANENKKIRHEHFSRDQAKFKSLLTIAEKNDPRLRAESQRLAAQLAKDKKEKEEKERQLKAAEAARKLEIEQSFQNKKNQEAIDRQDRHRAEKKKQEDYHKFIKEIKATMKLKGVDYNVIHPVDVESMIQKAEWNLSDVEMLRDESLELSVEDLTAVLSARFESFKADELEKQRKRLERKAALKQGSSASVVKPIEWTTEEMILLNKAINKFPGGTADRWNGIAMFIGTKNQKEVLAKATELCKGKSLSALGSLLIDSDKITMSKSAKPADAAANAPDVDYEKVAASVSEPNVWSPAQQKQLQTAMKTFPASLPAKERWVSIGKVVECKTAKQCLERFKEIKAKMGK